MHLQERARILKLKEMGLEKGFKPKAKKLGLGRTMEVARKRPM